MWIQASALLLTCCLFQAEAQNIWNNPIKFKTKANDSCAMSVTGQGEYTRLRMTCQSTKRSYWCEYQGKPHTCRPYSKNPRHYFVQMMWNLRKLHNACQAPRHIKPHMCKKAGDESQMVFKTASFSRYWPDATWKTATENISSIQASAPRPNSTNRAATRSSQVPQKLKTTQQHNNSTNRAATRSSQMQQKLKTTQKSSPNSTLSTTTTPAPSESHARRIARLHCWRSLQGICSVLIGWFHK